MSKTPELRFKGFTEDWESKTVKELMNEKVIEQPLDGNHGEIHPTTNDYVKTGIPFIMASDIQNGKINYSKCKYISEETAKGLRKGFAKEGDVLITHKATIGELAMVKNLNTEYMVLTPQVTYYRIRNYALLSNRYLKSYFESPSFMSVFKKLATDGSTRSYIGITKQQNLNIKYPNIEEQEKIASLFSLIDDKICLQGEKVEALKNYKKGMMQKIFSRELRFKDDEGRDYPEWEENKLGELFNIKAGGDIKSDNVSKEMTEKNIYPVYANALNNKGLYGYTDTFKVEGDTITVTGRGDIGYAIARNDKYYPIVRLLVLTPLTQLNTVYFENLINYTDIFVESTGVPQLTSPQLSQVKVSVPVFEEQNKVAKLLKGIDNKIEKEQEKLNSLNEYKKGLLQQIFV